MVFLTWARSFAVFFGYLSVDPRDLPCFPTRRSSDLGGALGSFLAARAAPALPATRTMPERPATRRRRLASGRSIITPLIRAKRSVTFLDRNQYRYLNAR